MKAIVYTEYGAPNVLKMKEVPRPAPKNNEVLIKVRATTVNTEDPKMRKFEFPPLLWIPVGLLFGFRKPRKSILGFEFAGDIESVGSKVCSPIHFICWFSTRENG
jgi:NADPH:quinone reductase-like Zn-dependent oxidoreductase